MATYTIYTEGVADVKFLEDILKARFDITALKPIKLIDKTAIIYFTINSHTLILKSFGGIGFFNGANNQDIISKDLERGTKDDKIAFVIDADTEKHSGPYGGFVKRTQFFTTTFRVTSDKVFLFPSNSQDGDLEVLLEKIIPKKNKVIFLSFEIYKKLLLISMRFLDRKANLPIRKVKIYSYLSVLEGSELARDQFREYTKAENWNLHHYNLNPLITFLTNFLAPINV